MKEVEILASLAASILNLFTAITNAIKEMFKAKKKNPSKGPGSKNN